MLITKAMFSLRSPNGTLKEQTIIRSSFWQIKSIRTGTTLLIAGNAGALVRAALGRPKKNARTDKKTEYKDNVDRIAVEKAFALYGFGLITSRLDETTGCFIVLSVISVNVDRISRFLL